MPSKYNFFATNMPLIRNHYAILSNRSYCMPLLCHFHAIVKPFLCNRNATNTQLLCHLLSLIRIKPIDKMIIILTFS